MRRNPVKMPWLALLAATAALGMAAAPAKANDPLFVFIPKPPPPENPPKPVLPPPTGYLNGACGLGVDSLARFYIADYYHHAIDVYSGTAGYNSTEPPPTGGTGYVTQLANVDPLGGPCAVALDSSNRLYVNNYHRNVTQYNASPSFGSGTVFPLPEDDTEEHLPTGVAVDTTTNTVYVNHRTYISVFDENGAPVMDGSEPLKIGVGTLGNGYGIAVSAFEGLELLPSTLGYLYVPDAATNTVKVYNPVADKVNPVAELKDPFNKPFVSLRDSAIAVDRVTGEIYFADNTQPVHTERPQAIIYVYRPNNTWRGYLKYKIVDALPPGLAVDNSPLPTQGRVYVTSGNTHQAGIYAYPPGAATTASPLPPTFTLGVSTAGSGSGSVTSLGAKLDCESACQRDLLAGGKATLTADPDSGSIFAGWSGACSGTDPTCAVTVDKATSVRASFAELAQDPPLTIAASSSSASVASTSPEHRSSRRAKRCRRSAKPRQRMTQRRRACRRRGVVRRR